MQSHVFPPHCKHGKHGYTANGHIKHSIMKKDIFKWTASMAAYILFAMLFSSCESDASEIAQMASLKAVAMPSSNTSAAEACNCLLTDYPIEPLSAYETEALRYMREEEKLAHDIYVKMKEKWGTNIFGNISKAEQRHTDAILCLLNKYDLDDPVDNNGVGAFTNATLQTVYNTLLAEGNTSLKAALRVGATIEDLDIDDLLERTSNIDNKDIKAVFGELTRASRNHIRAFNQNLTNQGETYVPQYISQALFDEIILSAKEPGGKLCGTGLGNCTGNCNGPGNGNGNCNGNGNGPGNGNGNGPGNGPGNGSGNGNGGN